MPEVRHRRITSTSSRPRRALILAVAAIGAAPVFARAADVTSRWASGTSGSWESSANWANTPALGGFPNNGTAGVATYNAVIDAAGGPYNVALNTSVTVDAFTLNSPSATFNHNAGTLTAAVGGINVQAGTYSLLNGTVANTTINQAGGTLVVGNSNARFSNVTVNGPLQLTAPGARLGVLSASTFNGAVTLGTATTGANLGFFNTQTIPATTYNVLGGSFISTEGAGTMTIPAGATIRGGNGGGIWYGFFATGAGNGIVNQGTIRADIAGSQFLLNAASGGVFTSTGTLAATSGGILNVAAQNWSSTGTVSVDGNSTVNLGGTFTSLGTIARSGGSINLVGMWDNTGRTVTLDATTGDVRFVNGTFKGGTVTFSGGALAVPVSGVGRIDGAHVNGSISLANSAKLGLLNGATVSGPVHTSDGSAIGLFTTQTAAATTYNLDGFSSYLSVEGSGAGTVTLPAGATVRGGNQGGIWFGFIADGSGAALDNRGAITADIAGRSFTVFPSGANRFFNSGTMSALNGASLTINAATWSNTASGRISATNSTLTLTGNWANAGTITVNNSTLNLGGTFTIASVGTLSRTGGTVNVTGTWDNAGSGFTFNPTTGDWVLNGGTVRGGSLNFAGAVMRFTDHQSNRFDNVTVNSPLVLDAFGARLAVLNGSTFNGDVTLSGNNVALGFFGSRTLSPVTYNVTGNNTYLSTETSGTFIIPAGATVRGGHAGTAGIWNNFFGGTTDGRVVNQGTIRADVSGGVFSILQSGAGTFENTGTLAATNGSRLLVDKMSGPLNTVTLSGAGSTVRIRTGTYTINQPVTVTSGATLYFDGAWTKSATIDVGGFVVFDYDPPAASPLAAMRAQIVQGYNGGAWNGGGFNSTAAAATANLALGYADSAALAPSGLSFGGQQVDGSAILVRLTRYGDANLDGAVDLADFNRLAANFGAQSGAVWTQGDFDYTGTVNLNDFNRLAANFGLSAAGPEVTPQDWASLAAAVPEPAGLSVAALAGAAVVRRRRRRCA